MERGGGEGKGRRKRNREGKKWRERGGRDWTCPLQNFMWALM